MLLRKWEDLPDTMKNDNVRKYYDILKKRQKSLITKRIFDFIAAIILVFILSPILLILSIAIKLDSTGPVMFRQIRVTQYGRQFRIFKFRTMVNNADKIGTQVTVNNDTRVTKVGKILRRLRLDEIPQLFNIISGDMSFVGTRPEVVKYIEQYSDGMMATLLLPAGVTSEASIQFKDEERLLASADNADEAYVAIVLPEKMKYNLRSIKEFSFLGEIMIMFRTFWAVIQKDDDSDDGVRSL